MPRQQIWLFKKPLTFGIVVVPTGEVKTGIYPLSLDLTELKLQPPSEEMWIQSLQTGDREIIGLGEGNISVSRLEDYVVAGLVNKDDIAYEDHADLLYDLARQVVAHFRAYLDEEETHRVLSVYQKKIADFMHAQMEFWEEATGYEAKVSRGFTELKKSGDTTPTFTIYGTPQHSRTQTVKCLSICSAAC